MPIIQARNLEKTYNDGETKTRALSDVSLNVEQGEFVAIMGASGSGKSTLLHILGLLDRQTKGEYFFNGTKNTNYQDEELSLIRNQEMGFVFQSFNLLARTDVFNNVKLPLLYSQIKEKFWDKAVKKAIESVGMGHRMDYYPSQLSGGEKQRVAIARALVNNPRIIFADEPTGNLDSVSGGKVMQVISNLHKQGKTIILITHETTTSRFAERIVTLKDGKVQSDEKNEKYNNTDLLFFHK